MITIACVYRSGGDFTADGVAKLAASIKEHVTVEHRICCLTDRPDEVKQLVDEAIPLKHDWPGWWAKMELFTLTGPVLYLDLDTWIVGQIDALCKWVEIKTDAILMLRGFYRNDDCSGIMAWNSDISWLTAKFASFVHNAAWKEQTHGVGCGGYQGDQDYIRQHLRHLQVPIVSAQDIQPGIYSYKVHVKDKGSIPADSSIICFHGLPRPYELKVEEIFQ